MVATPRLTRRSLVAGGLAGGTLATTPGLFAPAHAACTAILKPTPADRFVDFGSNAEMRWDSVDPRRYLVGQGSLFVRNHTSTPTIAEPTWRLRVYGDGLDPRDPRPIP